MCVGRLTAHIISWFVRPSYVMIDERVHYIYIYIYIYIYHHHHHHVALVARISLTLSRHSSLSFIAPGRSSGHHPVSSHSCWMYVRAGRTAFARPCVWVHKSISRGKITKELDGVHFFNIYVRHTTQYIFQVFDF